MNKRLALVTSLITLSALAPTGISSAVADPASGPSASRPSEKTAQYQVTGLSTRADRSAVARTGAAVDFVEHGTLHVTATASEVDRIERLGFEATPVPKLSRTLEADPTVAGFPTTDSNYHDYAETNAELRRIAAAYPQLAQVSVIGRSYEGREILAIKISDNVTTDEAEPEILLNGNIHAREHLTTEQALYMANMLTSRYSAETRVRGAVDSREWWIIAMLNPDGSEYDHAAGSYRSWRKNRQPNAGTTAIGTDLNRNFGYKWGCCNGSSTSPSSDTYRGPSAFSAPEAQVLRDFTLSRRVGGVQQIKAHIDIHSYGKLILWPYGYTYADTDTGLSPDQASTFATIGRQMANTNGYTPQQASELYVTDGTTSDWMWGTQGIWSYTFELYPDSATPGFYPPDEVIPAETARNKDAMLMLAEYADCPYRAIGKQQQYCGQTGGNLLTNPGFESGATGWTGTSGVITSSTSRPARTGTWKAWLGGNGTTSTENVSQSVTIPSTATAATLSYWIRTDTAETGSTVYDTMRVQVIDGTTTSTLRTFSNVGTSTTYTQVSHSLLSYKGKTVTIRFLANEDSSLQTSFVVDDTAVTVS